MQVNQGNCYRCTEGYILSLDEQSCVLNTICTFTDTTKQEKCESLNDEITRHHMNGCGKLSINHELRNTVNEPDSTESWDGEWTCERCKNGFTQMSIANEYCAPMTEYVMNTVDRTTN